jgi:4-oxalocrotonate tautomerase
MAKIDTEVPMMQLSDRGGKEMPEVYIHAIEGRTKEQKRALIKDITDAVVKNFDVTADAVLVEIIESSRDNKAKGGVLFSER